MNITKKLSTLSVDDLNILQKKILDEIQCRKNLSCVATTEAKSSVVVGQEHDKGEHSVAVSKPAPAAACPASP